MAKSFNVPKDYASVSVTDEDISTEAYKEHFGGGPEAWERRGMAQLRFLRERGLKPTTRLLDIGCGPLRGGVHFIEYLDPGNYCGVDYNADFIRAAQRIVETSGLEGKSPRLQTVLDFAFDDGEFDFALAFSVLNHCNDEHRSFFFRNISRPMKRGGRVFISHVDPWFDKRLLESLPLVNSSRFALSFRGNNFIPIVELTVL